MEQTRSTIDVMSHYESVGPCILLPRERALLSLYGTPSREWNLLPGHAREWLVCQAVLNDLVTAGVNGETITLSWVDLPRLLYRFALHSQRHWRGGGSALHMLSLLEGQTPAGRLAARLLSQAVSMRTLVEALQEAEEFLLIPPADLCWTSRRTGTLRSNCFIPSASSLSTLLLTIKRETASVYIHGSYADGGHTEFSDVDDVVVIHRSAWANYKTFCELVAKLEAAAQLMQRRDPLQHHGHVVLLDFDLAFLDQSIIPFVVLDQSVRLVGHPQIAVNVWDDLRGLGCNLWSLVQDLRQDALALSQERLNLYHLKRLVSTISLLPAVVFQIRGTMLDKKTAVRKASELFSPDAMNAVHWASSMRHLWGTSLRGYWFISLMKKFNQILPFRRNELERIAKCYSPVVGMGDTPQHTEAALRSICTLGDECMEHLREGGH